MRDDDELPILRREREAEVPLHSSPSGGGAMVVIPAAAAAAGKKISSTCFSFLLFAGTSSLTGNSCEEGGLCVDDTSAGMDTSDCNFEEDLSKEEDGSLCVLPVV
jgi:hypothetical protein